MESNQDFGSWEGHKELEADEDYIACKKQPGSQQMLIQRASIDQKPFSYEKSHAFYGLGGFLEDTKIINNSVECARAKVKQLQAYKFIDEQTRFIVIDFVVYNAYTGFFNDIIMVATFEANGLITTKLEMFNMEKDYYSDEPGDIFRAFCEGFFCLLLLYYLIIESIEISKDIGNQKKEHENKIKRKLLKQRQAK